MQFEQTKLLAKRSILNLHRRSKSRKSCTTVKQILNDSQHCTFLRFQNRKQRAKEMAIVGTPLLLSWQYEGLKVSRVTLSRIYDGNLSSPTRVREWNRQDAMSSNYLWWKTCLYSAYTEACLKTDHHCYHKVVENYLLRFCIELNRVCKFYADVEGKSS